MKCRTANLGPGVTAIVCSRGSRRETCQTPGCGKTSVALCDWPLAGALAGKTCDRRLCASCRRVQGPNKDFCGAHAAQANEEGQGK
jgi:hypothetical protein